MNSRERMLAACRGERVDRPPVWLMRQAGRYLPEYRALRERVGFLELCGDAEQAAEVSLQPWRRFGMDAIVVFSDILLPLSGLGLELEFAPGPRVANPLRARSDLARLEGGTERALEPTCEAIRLIRGETRDEFAVIGFAGAPWTLAAYALESELSRDLQAITALSYTDPVLLDRLLDRMTEITAACLTQQLEAGADVLQIFDTWAGMLAPDRFRRFAGRALRAVLERLPSARPPVILFARAAAHLVEELSELQPEVVSLDWRVDLAAAARTVGQRVSLQGNLDPAALMQRESEIERQVGAMIDAARPARGYIANLGHGVQPQTPVESVAAFVRAVQHTGR